MPDEPTEEAKALVILPPLPSIILSVAKNLTGLRITVKKIASEFCPYDTEGGVPPIT